MKRVILQITLVGLISSLAFPQQQVLNLNECINLAIKNHPQLQKAKIEEEVAYNGLVMAKSYRLPRLNLGSSMSRSTQGPSEYVFNNITFVKGDTTTQYYQAGINLRQTIYSGGSIRNSVKIAKVNWERSQKQYEMLRQQIVADVTEKFYNLLKQQELLKVYQLAYQNSQEQLRRTDELFRLGKVAKKDLYKAQVREGNTRLEVIRQEAQVKLAGDELKRAMGILSSEEIVVEEVEYQIPETPEREEVIERVLANNPQLKMLSLQRESAKLNYYLARSEYRPTIDASFNYARGGSEAARLIKDFDKWWNTSLTVSLNYPIFQGFYKKANVQQRYLQYKSYDQDIALQMMELINRVDNLLTSLKTYIEMIKIGELNVVSAEEDLRLQQEMYRLNSATLLEVLDAQVALTRAQGELITNKYQAKIAEVQLKLLMGAL